MDKKKGNFRNPLSYGGNDRRAGRCAYGVVKMAYISCIVPFCSSLANNLIGVIPSSMGLWRAYKTQRGIREN